MPDLLHKQRQPLDEVQRLKQEIEETYRGVLELAYGMGEKDKIEQVLTLREEIHKLTDELDETYRGVIEMATSLENSEEKVERITRGAGLGLWDWIPASGELNINQEWARVADLNYDNFDGNITSWEKLIHPDDYPDFEKTRNSFLNSKRKLFHSEHRLKTGEGNWVWVLANGRTTNYLENGKPQRISGSMLNIDAAKKAEQKIQALNKELEQRVTERSLEIERTNERLMEEIRGHQFTVQALRQARKASEAANQAKSTFVANMSHELRTPLNAIIGYAQLLGMDKNLDDDHRIQINAINRAGNHLLNLINDVLDMAKIEAGRAIAVLSVFDLHILLDDIKALFSIRAKQAGIKLRFQWNESLPRYIRSDQQKIRQILINLMGNAIKFTEEGSVILDVADEKTDNKHTLVFSVMDTGVGIAETDIDMIFQKFEQTENSVIKGGGTGLGLAICREFAGLLNGKIIVQSKLGEGSSFQLSVPVEVEERTTELNIQPNTNVIGIETGQRIIKALIIEDDDANRDVMVRILEPLEIQTRQANNGKSGLIIFKEWKPTFVVLDMIMPEMGGMEMLRKFQLQPGIDKVPIIVVTGMAEEEITKQALNLGASAILSKPFNQNDFLSTIAKHVGIQLIFTKPSQESLIIHEPKSLTAKDIDSLPYTFVDEFKTAIIIGNTHKMRELATKVNKFDESISEALLSHIDNYEIERLLSLFSLES